MPDLDYTRQILSFDVPVPVSKSVDLRFLYRYEQGTVDDWHYAGVAENSMPTDNSLYPDAGPRDYRASNRRAG